MHPFRTAVGARDIAAIEAFLADDVVFTRQSTFKPYLGKDRSGPGSVANQQVDQRRCT